MHSTPLLKEFFLANTHPNAWMNKWQQEGKKILGYFCTYIPDEIISAADILPIRIKARQCTDTPVGDAYMAGVSCSFTRCCLEAADRKQLNYLDGIVSCNSCDQVRRLYDNIRYKAPFPYHYFLSVPANVNEITVDWYQHELGKFKDSLQANYGAELAEADLTRTIKIYNKSRTLLRELYTLRKREEPPLSGTDIMYIITAGLAMPRDTYNELLSQQLQISKNNGAISNYKGRVMIVGSLLDNPEYVKIIEDLGGLVVTDSLCYGTRYFWDLVNENSNPLAALADRYMSKVSCPRMVDGHTQRMESILNFIKEYYVDGVIFERMKFCPYWWGEIFMMRSALKELGVPFIDLEREYVLGGVGQMKTRIQAFMEVLAQG